MTRVCGTRTLLAAGVFMCVAVLARDASAVFNNTPFLDQYGQPLIAKSQTAGDATIFRTQSDACAYFAYIRVDSSLGIIVDCNVGGGTNLRYYSLAGPAKLGPALVSVSGTLYLFWIKSTNGHQMVQESSDGFNWTAAMDLDPSDSPSYVAPPAGVAWDGNAIVWVGQPSIFQFNVAGSWFGEYHPFVESTYSRPSATLWQGALWLAWVDANNGNQVGVSHWTDSTGWYGESLSGMHGVASIYPDEEGALEMVFRGSDSHIYRTYSGDGAEWTPPIEDTASTTNHQPVQFDHYSWTQNWVFYIGIDNELFTVIE